MSGDLQARLKGRIGALALEVAFTAAAGEVTALVGPSGSGKTTILRALAGLERLTGEVRCGSKTWQDGARFMPPHRRGAGYVTQHGGLLPHLSVRANLAYAGRRAGLNASATTEAVDLMEIGPLLDRRPDRLSGGERQRVAVARALVGRPRLVLLDEPLSGLDVDARAALMSKLKAALATLDAPVVYVSHDPAEVREMAARVLRLEAGRLVTSALESDPLAGRSPGEVAALARAALSAGLTPEALTLPAPG